MSNRNPVDPKYKYYLYDLGDLLKERALKAKEMAQQAPKDSPSCHFQTGRLMAFNEVISIMQQQAEGFAIALEELRLDDIDPDRDLV